MNPQKVTMAIARYNENLDWLRSLPFPYVVLNKGERLPDWIAHEVNLPNIGREAHSYLTYIVDNFDNFSDYTVFVQGSPFVHAQLFVQKLNDFSGGSDFFGLSDMSLRCDGYGNPNHRGLKVSQSARKLFRDTFTYYDFPKGAEFIVSKHAILFHSKLTYKKILDFLAEGNLSNEVCTIPKHLKNCGCMKPFSPWVMERLWKRLFDRTHKTLYDNV